MLRQEEGVLSMPMPDEASTEFIVTAGGGGGGRYVCVRVRAISGQAHLNQGDLVLRP